MESIEILLMELLGLGIFCIYLNLHTKTSLRHALTATSQAVIRCHIEVSRPKRNANFVKQLEYSSLKFFTKVCSEKITVNPYLTRTL